MEPLGDTIEYREHDGVRSINAVIQEFGDGGRRGIRKVAGKDDYRASPVLVKGGKCRQNPSQRALPGPGVGDHFMADGLGQAVSTPDQEHGGKVRPWPGASRRPPEPPCPRPYGDWRPQPAPPRPLPGRRRSPIHCRPRRIELTEEELTTFLFVNLPNLAGHPGEAVQAAQEATVLESLPPDESRAAPATLAKPVQAAVVADPIGGVGLDAITGQIAERCPGGEASGPACRHRSHGIALNTLAQSQRLPECVEATDGFGIQDGLGRAAPRQAHRVLFAHGRGGYPSPSSRGALGRVPACPTGSTTSPN